MTEMQRDDVVVHEDDSPGERRRTFVLGEPIRPGDWVAVFPIDGRLYRTLSGDDRGFTYRPAGEPPRRRLTVSCSRCGRTDIALDSGGCPDCGSWKGDAE